MGADLQVALRKKPPMGEHSSHFPYEVICSSCTSEMRSVEQPTCNPNVRPKHCVAEAAESSIANRVTVSKAFASMDVTWTS